jgi:hypothetical protein
VVVEVVVVVNEGSVVAHSVVLDNTVWVVVTGTTVVVVFVTMVVTVAVSVLEFVV